jgi:hypothetical protein
VGKALAVNGSGDVCFAANFNGIANFGSINLNSAAGCYSLAIVKLSGSTGGALWAKRYGTSYNDMPNGLSIDRFGDFLITGTSSGPTDLGAGTIGNGGTFLAKYSGIDGTCRWAKILGGNGNGIATDPVTSNVYVTGGFSGITDFGGGAVTTRDNGGIFIAGYDSSGNYLWAKAYGQSGDAGYAVAVDGNGRLAVATYNSGGIDFQGTGFYSSGYFLINFTISGTSAPSFQWAVNGGISGRGVGYDWAGHVLAIGVQGTGVFVGQYTK